MRAFTALALILVWNSQASAGPETAIGGGSTFITDELFIPVNQPGGQQPGGGWQPSVTPAKPPAATPGTGNPCPPSRPYKESSPFKVFVDQATQTMTVTSPDFPEPLVFPVSTGGTLKEPDPKSGVKPYCAETPEISQRIVTAFETSDFAGRRDCTEDNIRGRSTLWPGNTYRSGQFKTEGGEGALMPNAIRVQGGKFIHRCTGDGCKNLGQPVSGECIRVPGWRRAPTWAVQAAQQRTLDSNAISYKVNRYRSRDDDRTVTVPEIEISETLAKQMKKYGAIDVQVGPPPPMRPSGTAARQFPHVTRPYCDAADVAAAEDRIRRGIVPEGGWSNDWSNFWGGLFGGGNQQRREPEIQRPPETPEQQRAREREQRRREREQREWRDRVFRT